MINEDDSIHNCYSTLFEELLNGEIRVNDDFRILQYECAIRKVVHELNIIINANPLKPNLVKESLLEVYKAGICTYEEHPYSSTYLNEDTMNYEHEEGIQRFIWLDALYLDYPFLDDVKDYEHPLLSEDYDDYDYESDPLGINPPEPSKLNKPSRNSKRVQLSVKKGLFGWINDGSIDIKTFLKYFPSVLEKEKKDRINNIEKIIDMFYVYDQYTFLNEPIGEITPIYNELQSNRTKRDWIKKIEYLISTYQDYQFNN